MQNENKQDLFAMKYINKLKRKYQENTFVQQIVIEYKMYIRPPKINAFIQGG